jgi:hypothetical protein
VADILIRNTTVEDSEPISRLATELGYPTSTSQMRQRLEAIVGDDDYATFVACDDAEIVGVIGTRIGRLYEVVTGRRYRKSASVSG